jgi:hypothetical protein
MVQDEAALAISDSDNWDKACADKDLELKSVLLDIDFLRNELKVSVLALLNCIFLIT